MTDPRDDGLPEGFVESILQRVCKFMFPRPGLYTNGRYVGRVKMLNLRNLQDSPAYHTVAGGVFNDGEMRWMTDAEYEAFQQEPRP